MSLRNQNLAAYNVDTCNDFGHSMLDLNTRVHLDEEPLVGIHIVEEFNRAGAVIVDGFCDLYGGIAKRIAHAIRQANRRRDLNDLLVAALHGAVALMQVHHIALLVTENLHFNVLSALDVAFKENGGVAECTLCLSLRFLQ